MISAANPSRFLVAGLAFVCFLGYAHALDPHRIMSQYVRQQWNAESGFPGGAVHAIAQTADGYLWIGTDKGLVRFDGFNFHLMSSSIPAIQADPILGLMTDADGRLWVHLQGAGMRRYNNGKLESIAGLQGTATQVTAIWRGKDGAMLLSNLMEGTLRFRGEQVEALAPPTVLPGSSLVISMAQTSDGKIWLGTLGAGLFYLADGRATNVAAGLPEKKINCLLPVGNQELWAGTDNGLFRWNGTVFSKVELTQSVADIQILALLRDHDSNVWVATTRGLLRIDAKGVSFSDESGFGSGGINALFEDREGNLWVGGARGLERIRNGTFVTYSPTGTASEHSGPVYVDSENRTWFAPAEGGMYLLKDGRIQSLNSPLLKKSVIYSTTGWKDEIWVGTQHSGLTRIEYNNGIARTQTYTQANGLAENSVYVVYESGDGAVWAGTLTGGVSKFTNGKFSTYTTASGLASNTVAAIVETRDGTLWFGTPNGLSSFSRGQWKGYTARDGLPSDNVNCLFEDSSGMLWIGTSEGLGFFRSGHMHSVGDVPDRLREPTFGLAEDKNGSLWIATSHHVIRVPRDKLSSGTVAASDVHEYGIGDGLRSTEGVQRSSSVVSDSEGRVWFSMDRGLSVVFPSNTTENSAPALAHVEVILADSNPISMGDLVRIPPSRKRITFSYTGLSLALPERVRFRYRLDSFDPGWSDPVASREAVYTNLGPGSYRFRLIASNSEGAWNGAETSVAFEVEPALWQTWWFRSACLVLTALAMLFLYRFRLHQLTRQLNIRFEERLSERTRIAQELHDTLLQGVLSASMQLNVANDQLSDDSRAKPLVSRVLELMGQVIEDGRNAVRGLRISKDGTQDLGQAFSRIPQELAAQGTADFHVIVEGSSRALNPAIRDEVYRIGREAAANAFRHSGATTIEVGLVYGVHELRLLVRDNGRGIDAQVLQSGRDGHWGLSGMRERAERVGAKLRVWSSPGHGTEVDLRIPGRIAFEAGKSHHPSQSSPTPRWTATPQSRNDGAAESKRQEKRVG